MDFNSSPIRRSGIWGRALTPWQFVALAAFTFLGLSCGVLAVLGDWSNASFGRSIVRMTAALSLLLAPAVCIGALLELLRRGWDWRVFLSGLLAASGIAIFAGAFCLKLRELGI